MEGDEGEAGLEGDSEWAPRGPIEDAYYVVLDDLKEGAWYSFVCDDETIYGPFCGFRYDASAKSRGGCWFKVRMANQRIKLIWSGHIRKICRE